MLESDENNQNREVKRQNIGRKIWTSMLDADLNAKYWEYIGRKQFKKNKVLKYEFEDLWADIEANDENLDLHTIAEGYNRVRQKQKNVLLVLQSFGLPDDEDLIEACYREVLSSRGLYENQN